MDTRKTRLGSENKNGVNITDAGRCVHCLKKFTKLTRDHILPKSYYICSTLGEVECWTAPACERCNNELGKIEDELLVLLGLCMNAHPYGTSPTIDISQRVLRSLNPHATDDEREKRIRKARAKKIIDKLFRVYGSTEGLLPNFSYHYEWKPEEQFGIHIPAEWTDKVGKKIIRGIEYRLGNRFIDPSFDLTVNICYEETVRDMIDLIRRHGQHFRVTRGFEFYRAAPFKQEYCLYEVRIWDKFVFYGSLIKQAWWRLPFNYRYIRYKLFGS